MFVALGVAIAFGGFYDVEMFIKFVTVILAMRMAISFFNRKWMVPRHHKLFNGQLQLNTLVSDIKNKLNRKNAIESFQSKKKKKNCTKLSAI